MENVKKHLQENYDSASNQYFDCHSDLVDKKLKLTQLEREVASLESTLDRLDTERKYFETLLNEVNNNSNNEF